MFEAIREWIANNQRASFIIGLALAGVLALVLAGGIFEIEFSQFFAVEPRNGNGRDRERHLECVSNSCRSVRGFGDDDCSPIGSSCDGTTNGAEPEPCNPVTAPGWDTAASPQCTPFPTPPAVSPPPLPDNYLIHAENTLAEEDRDCFGFTLEDNEWEAFDAHTGGQLAGTAGILTLSGKVFNNCPWPVQMRGAAAGSPKPGNDFIFREDGTVDEPVTPLDELVSRIRPPPSDPLIPSCFNYSHLPDAGTQQGCKVGYTVTVDAGEFNAGRVEVSLGWRHMVGGSGQGFVDQDGYNIVLNYGRVCTGIQGETCPTQGVGGTGTTGISGPGPGGAFNCGTGERSDRCWCGEWGDALWAQRHANAAHQCSPGFVLTAELKAFLEERIPSFDGSEAAPDGTSDDDFLGWSRGKVQAFMDIMNENFSTNQSCTPRSSGVDYAGIQQAYWAIGSGGIGLSGNGTAAVARLCKDNIGIDPAILTAACTDGRAPIFLSWNISVGSVANGLLRRIDGGEAQFLSGIGRFQDNYTDSDVEAGHTYQYQHKSHASVASDPVDVTIEADGTCRVEGVETPTPTVSPTPSPTPTPSPSPTPTPTVSITPPPPSNGDDDFDNDGIPDDVECPTASQGFCRDSDGDGSPDFADTTGIVSDAGVTPTGPAAATFLAFMLASITVLLYVSYTHTSLFRRREIQKVSDDGDSMDFRQ